jgi:uncharacterized protein YlxP (DUF503 family)
MQLFRHLLTVSQTHGNCFDWDAQFRSFTGTIASFDGAAQFHSPALMFVTGEPLRLRMVSQGLVLRIEIVGAMPVAQLTLELRIEHAQSLKDRRQVVRSMKDQLRQGFNISIAEMDEAVTWQSATLGIVAISHSRSYLHGLIEEVERAARRMANELGAELADSFWDYVES